MDNRIDHAKSEAALDRALNTIMNEPILRQQFVSWCNMLLNWQSSKLYGMLTVRDVERSVAGMMAMLSRGSTEEATEHMMTLCVNLSRPVAFTYMSSGVRVEREIVHRPINTALN